jgi:hypothetical protein
MCTWNREILQALEVQQRRGMPHGRETGRGMPQGRGMPHP